MDASAALVKVLREEGPRVLAALVRQLGDLPVAEDALSGLSATGPSTGWPHWRPSSGWNFPISGTPLWPTISDGLAGRQRLPESWKPPPRWRPPRPNDVCFCPVSST